MALLEPTCFVHLEADILLPGHGEPWHGSVAGAVALARAAGAA